MSSSYLLEIGTISEDTLKHLVCKQTLNHLAKLVKCLSVRLETRWLWVQVLL